MTYTPYFVLPSGFSKIKKAMEEVFSDPFDKGYDYYFPRPTINGGTRLHVAKKSQVTSVDWHPLVRRIYSIVLCYVTIHLGARNTRQVPAVERAIKQKFMDTEWDEYNAETFLDIESPEEWWEWMENVAIPNLYSPIGVPGQNNIEAVGDLPISDIAEIEKTEGLGNILLPVSCQRKRPTDPDAEKVYGRLRIVRWASTLAPGAQPC